MRYYRVWINYPLEELHPEGSLVGLSAKKFDLHLSSVQFLVVSVKKDNFSFIMQVCLHYPLLYITRNLCNSTSKEHSKAAQISSVNFCDWNLLPPPNQEHLQIKINIFLKCGKTLYSSTRTERILHWSINSVSSECSFSECVYLFRGK